MGFAMTGWLRLGSVVRDRNSAFSTMRATGYEPSSPPGGMLDSLFRSQHDLLDDL